MHRWPSCPTAVLLAALAVAAGALPAPAEERALGLGAVEFPTSGSPEAQAHFLRGVAAMHSFWYEEALGAFREATRLRPDFVMGYWGEAMAHNHPVWQEQNLEAARAALAKMPSAAPITERERAYVRAVEILYGQGPKEERDRAYAAAMEDLHRRYPGDLEAACLHALALLGVAEYEPRGSRTHIRAGAIALDVFRENPNHPCAAHYTIHAFDDPDHAILALPAARRYAEIAPDAHHAQHMPAHIFLQLGMWDEAAAANQAGWQASVEWVARERLPMGLRDYHSLHWLHYVYLQQGRFRDARELLALKQLDMRTADPAEAHVTGYERSVARNYDEMVAAYAIDAAQWGAARELLPGPGRTDHDSRSALVEFTTGYAAVKGGDAERASQSLARLDAQEADEGSPRELLAIWKLELTALLFASAGALDRALERMDQAVSIEEGRPLPSGPPSTIKPPHELMGQLLLAADRPEDAREYFEAALSRHPNRARALLGAARASARSEHRAEALDAYRRLLAVWDRADAGLAELEEARRYIEKSKE